MKIAASLTGVVWFMLWAMTPVAWPIGALLDRLIPHDSHAISRREVTALVEVTREMAKSEVASGHADENPDGLSEVEERLVRGALTLSSKLVVDVMVPYDDVFSLPVTAKLDTSTMALIARRGFSRIPIAQSERKGSFSVYLLTKELVTVAPTDSSKACNITQYATHFPAWIGNDPHSLTLTPLLTLTLTLTLTLALTLTLTLTRSDPQSLRATRGVQEWQVPHGLCLA